MREEARIAAVLGALTLEEKASLLSGQPPLGKLGAGYDAAPGEFALRSDQVMFGVDNPHLESIYPSTRDQVAALLAEPTVTAADAEKILFGSAAGVYGFDPAVLRQHIERVGFTIAEGADFVLS